MADGIPLALAAPAHATSPPAPVVVDDCESSAAWTAVPASGVDRKLSLEPGVHGNALRVDFRFTKVPCRLWQSSIEKSSPIRMMRACSRETDSSFRTSSLRSLRPMPTRSPT